MRLVRVLTLVLGALILSGCGLFGLPVLVIAAATIRPPAVFCDGVVAPIWAGDPCGGGYVPTLLDYVWPPEHWFAPSQCYGLCGSLE